MNEEEWLTSSYPTQMLNFVRGKSRDGTLRNLVRGRSSDRKLRLFGVACCRRVHSLLSDQASKLAVDVAERFADGLASLNDLAAVNGDSLDAAYDAVEGTDLLAIHAAASAHAVTFRAAKNAAMACDAVRRASIDGVAESAIQANLLRHIIGNPFRPYPAPPSWPSPVVKLADSLYAGEDCSFALHDALLEAGHPELAEHFREKEHPKGCWVVDMILGKS